MSVTATARGLLLEHDALVSSVRASQLKHRKWLASLPSPPPELLNLPLVPAPPAARSPERAAQPPPQRVLRADVPPTKRARAERYRNYVPEEETIRNDYSQRYVDGGDYPQNWVLGAEPERRFEECAIPPF